MRWRPARDKTIGKFRPNVLVLFPIMDRAFSYTVADLARDEVVALECSCRVRSYSRAELMARVGADARLHLIGMRRELRCAECGDAAFRGWLRGTPAAAIAR